MSPGGNRYHTKCACIDCGKERFINVQGPNATPSPRCPKCAHKESAPRRLASQRANEAERGIDDVVVDRLIAGSPVTSTTTERRKATEVLAGVYGLTDRRIAARLNVSVRTVERYRSALGNPPRPVTKPFMPNENHNPNHNQHNRYRPRSGAFNIGERTI